MRKLYFILAFGFAINPSFAQTNIFPASGNVGIGTTTPTYTLSFGTHNNTIFALFENPGGSNMFGFGYGTSTSSTDIYANGTKIAQFSPSNATIFSGLSAGNTLFSDASGHVGINNSGNTTYGLQISGSAGLRVDGPTSLGSALNGTTASFNGNNTVYGNIMASVTPGTYSNGNSTGHGFGLISNTSFTNHGAMGQIGLVQTTPDVNDIAAGVYLKIGGWYQNSGTSLPIALGGGFLSISPSIYIAAGSGVGGGNVGIGTTNTQGDKFQVATGGQYFRSGTWGIGIADAGWRNTLILSNNYTYHEIYSSTGSPLVFQNANGGNVLIGKTSQTNPSYKLDVNGNMRANEVVVNASGADFVFDPSYRLPSLSKVENYIRHNKHLPEVASAKEMQTKGLNLGENQIKLLQKVEELTLYVIEQNKKIEELQKEVTQLKDKEE